MMFVYAELLLFTIDASDEIAQYHDFALCKGIVSQKLIFRQARFVLQLDQADAINAIHKASISPSREVMSSTRKKDAKSRALVQYDVM